MSVGKYFIDTNVFVYSFDETNPSKRKKAIALIKDGLTNGRGVISSQVVQEFLNVALRKLPVGLRTDDVNDYLDTVLMPMCMVFPDAELYKMALDLQRTGSISFYDAIIVTAAFKAGCKVIYTEDLQHGQVIAGIKIQNPFI